MAPCRLNSGNSLGQRLIQCFFTVQHSRLLFKKGKARLHFSLLLIDIVLQLFLHHDLLESNFGCLFYRIGLSFRHFFHCHKVR